MRTGGGIRAALSRLQQQIALLAGGGHFLPRADSLPAGRADRVNRSRRASAHHRRGPKDPRRTRHHPRLARSRRPLDASPPPRDRDRADRGRGARILSNPITRDDFLIDRFSLLINNLSVKRTSPGEKRWNRLATVK